MYENLLLRYLRIWKCVHYSIKAETRLYFQRDSLDNFTSGRQKSCHGAGFLCLTTQGICAKGSALPVRMYLKL